VSESSRRLRLRRGFLVVPGQETLHLRSLRRVLQLRGKASITLLPQVLAHLDGSKSVDEVAAAMGNPEQVKEVVALLERAGLLQDSAEVTVQHELAPFAALLDGLGVDAQKALEQLGAHRFGALVSPRLRRYVLDCLTSFGVFNEEIVNDIDLEASGNFEPGGPIAQEIAEFVSRSSVVFVALDRWQPAFMSLVNEACVKAGRPWIGVQPESEVGFMIGPFVIPGETACFTCFERRRQANRFEGSDLDIALRQMVESQPHAAGYLDKSVAPLFEPAIALAVTEAMKYAAGLHFYMSTLNRVVGFTPFMLETESIPVLKLPRCPSCSRVASAQAERVWMGE